MFSKLKPVNLFGNDYTVNDIDTAVRSRWNLKDSKLDISGLPKKLIGKKDGFKIYEVDGEWIKNNIDVGFGTGGHGLVHSYIPMDEVWVYPVIENKWSIALHEIVENKLMKIREMKYKEAHKETTKLTEGLDIKDKKQIHARELLGKV